MRHGCFAGCEPKALRAPGGLFLACELQVLGFCGYSVDARSDAGVLGAVRPAFATGG